MTTDQKVRGSNPCRCTNGPVAQLVERRPEEASVSSSNLFGSTTLECSSVGLEYLADTEGVVGSSPTFPTMVLYPSGQRELFAKQLLAGSNPARTSNASVV